MPTTHSHFRPEPGAEPGLGYILETQLGAGGFGEVWRAVGPDGRRHAIKFVPVVSDSDDDDNTQGQKFQAELRSDLLLRDISHLHLLSIFHSWQVRNFLAIAMELAAGTLADTAKRYRKQGLPGIPRDELLEYMDEAAKAIDFLNEPRHTVDGKPNVRLVHRDIKPTNLLMVGGSIKVGDFGLVRHIQRTQSQHTGMASVHYAAPEIFQRVFTVSIDQYALAISYMEMLTGRRPFEGENESDIGPVLYGHMALPPSLDPLPVGERGVIGRALAKVAAERWPTCRAMVRALAAAGRGSPTVRPKNRPPLDSTPTRPQPNASAGPASGARRKTKTVSPRKPESNTLVTPKRLGSKWLARLLPPLAVALIVVGIMALMVRPRSNDKASEPKPAALQRPALLHAPFDAATASARQQEWAAYLGRSVIETIDLGRGEKMDLVLIPPGVYKCGASPGDADAEDDEKPPREITISQPFYMGKYEVTHGQFRAFVADTGYKSVGIDPFGWNAEKKSWEQNARYSWEKPGFPQDSDRHPVVCVSWTDADKFCKWLSKKTKHLVVLPREAEWEYAARAGTTTRYLSGDDSETVAAIGNIADGTAKKSIPSFTTINAEDNFVFTAPFGQFAANRFGLHDTTGNVWEWCQDYYDAKYYQENIPPSVDPKGPNTGKYRVHRGGAWDTHPRGARVSFRSRVDAASRGIRLGFRVSSRLD